MPVLAVGSTIAAALLLTGTAAAVTAFAINLVISSVISKIFAPDAPSGGADNQPNPGAGQQLPPAGDNKLPVIYGTAFTGGAIIDTSITKDNHTIYWVFALCEVTNTENGGTGDNITFGDIFWGGKKCIFDSTSTTRVNKLRDESTGIEENVSGFLNIYLYNNGSDSPTNTSQSAISVMQDSDLIYKWNGDKRMTNCAFAIVRLKYSASRNLTGLSQTRFQVINSRTDTGDCFYDYLTSVRYGAAILPSNIDTTSLDELTAYSNASISYIPWTGGLSNIPRFKFNGMLDTNQKIMRNIQSMADCCDCLVKYNEVDGKWGVIVQKPTYTVAMALNDSNIIGGITVSPVDLSNSFNYIECKFPDGDAKDSFNSANFDLAVLAPELLFPNEPVNKESVNLYLTNSDITAQLIANRMLKAAREDLQVQLEINFTGLQLEAGDVVTLTNLNYGWNNKLFRAIKVVQKFSEDGKITTALNLSEYNPEIYSDSLVTQFVPLDNTGLGDPSFFGAIPAPVITNILPSASNPAFFVVATSSLAGITQYAEIWYSAYQFPTEAQRIFAGVTEVQASSAPYQTNTVMPPVQLFNVPAGNWYFFSRMVNSVATSDFSPASLVLQWRPMTFQYENRYLCIAYADSITGTGFSLNPRNKSYFGLFNPTGDTTPTVPTDPTAYKWYLADPLFGTNIYLAYISYQNRRFGFDTDFATYAGGTDEFGSGGAFVPTTTSKFDFRIWSALPDGTNVIDLDKSTGQTIITGMPSTSDGQISVRNTPDGKLVAELAQYLTFPDGGSTFTSSAATITVDRYGRIVGFSPPDDFFYSYQTFTATSGQTLFTPTARVSGYIAGQDLIFQNGVLLDPSEYTETTTTFTLSVGAVLNDVITCISMRGVSGGDTYSVINLTVASSSTNTVVWNSSSMPYELIDIGDKITFANSGTPTQYTVTGVNYGTRTITFSTNPSVSAGAIIYKFRAAGSSYRTFSRFDFDLTDANSYTPTTWTLHSAYELIFFNGTVVNEQDYDITANSIVNMPAIATGRMTVIQFTENNLTTPTGSATSVVAYTGAGATYAFNYNALAFNLYGNGCLFRPISDYTTATNSYTFTNIPDVGSILVQQTFAAVGAA